MKKKQLVAKKKCTALAMGTLFIPYLNDDVALDDRTQLEAHLAACPVCREELLMMYELQQHWDRLRRLP